MELPLALFSLSSMLSSLLLYIKNKSMNYFLYRKCKQKQFITSDAALSEFGLFLFFPRCTFSFFLYGQRESMKFFRYILLIYLLTLYFMFFTHKILMKASFVRFQFAKNKFLIKVRKSLVDGLME